MKSRLLSFVLVLLGGPLLFGQSQIIPSTITVQGYAQKSVVPNQIYMTVTLQEYQDGSRKVSMDQLERQLMEATAMIGIEEREIILDNVNGYGAYGQYGNQEFLLSKTYIVRLKNAEQLNRFAEKLGDLFVTNANVSSLSHSNMDEYLDELRVEALENAREQAQDLAKASGKELGGLIAIQQPTSYDNSYGIGGYTNYELLTELPAEGLDLRPMLISYDIQVTYSWR